jgi:uncharacterized protein
MDVSHIYHNNNCPYIDIAFSRRWLAHQSWRDVFFLHREVNPELILPFIPKVRSITPDTFAGKAWITLVGFKVTNSRLRYLPPLPGTDSFVELNLRTYVRCGEKAGITFMNIDASTLLAATVFKLTGLPYKYAPMKLYKNSFKYRNSNKYNFIDLRWKQGSAAATSAIDHWLTERYVIYQQVGRHVYSYPVCHTPWNINSLDLARKNISYYLGDQLIFSEYDLDRMHYSEGVDALFYMRKRISCDL